MKIIKEWRNPKDKTSENILTENTVRRLKLIKEKWKKCKCNLKDVYNFGCNICKA
jgi:hypothetical protein